MFEVENNGVDLSSLMGGNANSSIEEAVKEVQARSAGGRMRTPSNADVLTAMFLANMNGRQSPGAASNGTDAKPAKPTVDNGKNENASSRSLPIPIKKRFLQSKADSHEKKVRCLSVASSASGMSGQRRRRQAMSIDDNSVASGFSKNAREPSRSLGSQPATSAATSASRRERKNNREKQRRLEVNIMFDRLMKMLGLPKDSKSDKVKVLSHAIETISELRYEMERMQTLMKNAGINYSLDGVSTFIQSTSGVGAQVESTDASAMGLMQATSFIGTKQEMKPQQN
jgi:hypothetical protein